MKINNPFSNSHIHLSAIGRLLCLLAGIGLLSGLANSQRANAAGKVSDLQALSNAAQSGDEAAIIKAIDTVGADGPSAAAALPTLTDLLKDKSSKVRGHAAWALGQIGSAAKSAASPLADLLKDSDASVRRAALRAIRAIHPGPAVMIPLFVKLMEDNDPGIRARVLNAVAEAGPAAVPGLIEALKNDKAKYWALIILRDIGPAAKDAVPAVAGMLKDERPEIRREAVLTLGAMGDDAKTAIPQIAELVKDQNAGIAATFVLGQLGKIPPESEADVTANTKSTNKLLSTVSYWALARVHPENIEMRRDATEQLIARLKEPNEFVRVTAARALAALPPAPEITGPIWEKELKNADPVTLSYALDALAELGAPAVPRLTAALTKGKLRAEAAIILGRIGPAAAPAAKTLGGLVKDKDLRVAHEAIVALGRIGPGAKAAVPALAEALAGEDRDANFPSIAYALGRIGPSAASAQSALIEVAGGKDPKAAVVSAWALAAIDPTDKEVAGKVLPVLIHGLKSDSPQVRHTAIEGLAAFGGLAESAVGPLEKVATKDANPEVRHAAVKAAAEIAASAKATSK